MYEKGDISFIDACLNQTAAPQDVESYVEYWHTHEVNCTLREYLGMSAEEYASWVKRGDDAIPEILQRRGSCESAERTPPAYVICPTCGALIRYGRRCQYCAVRARNVR
ncbi:MAG: hypothetical protein IJQ81_15895 [Oscillibacter sp.]|nr:hypothetical protein [Oscillibacter sp.]